MRSYERILSHLSSRFKDDAVIAYTDEQNYSFNQNQITLCIMAFGSEMLQEFKTSKHSADYLLMG